MQNALKEGDKFIIQTGVLKDKNIVNWYLEQPDPVLTVEKVDEDTNSVWAKGCPHRIEWNGVKKVDLMALGVRLEMAVENMKTEGHNEDGNILVNKKEVVQLIREYIG